MKLIATGVRMLRRHWKPLVAASALFGGLGLIFAETTSAHLGEVLAPMITTDPTGAPAFVSTDANLDALLWAFALSMAGSQVAAACVTVASLVASLYVDRDYRGGSITFRAAAAHAVRRAPVAIAAWLLTELALVGLVVATAALAILTLTVFPGDATSGGLGALLALIIGVAGAVVVVSVSIRWSLNAVVVALEPVGPVHALRRAWHLTGDNTWRAFGLQLLVVVVVSLLSTLVSESISAIASSGTEGASTLPFGPEVAISVVIGVLTASILPVMLAVLYFDLRVRRDQFELPLDPQP